MLPKIHRLSLRTEFSRIKKVGQIFPGKMFGLLLVDDKSSSPPQFSFIVSKRIHPRAFQRNRIRRLLSEAILSLITEIKPGAQGVFLVKKAIIGQPLAVLKREVESVFQKAGIFQK